MITTLIWLFFAIVVIGVLFWAAKTILAVIPVDEPFKTVAYVILVLLAVVIVFMVLSQILGPIARFPSLR